MAVEDSLDIFGSDPFGRDYLYGLGDMGNRQGLAPYGFRYAENLSQPTTTKKSGYLGDVGGYIGDIGEPRSVMSELSASSEIGGRTVQYPLIVPTLTAQELMLLHSGGQPTPEIYNKAQSWAVSRLRQGQDPFATPVGLRYPQPERFNPAPRVADQVQESPRGFTSGLFSDVLGGTLNMPSMPRTGVPSLDLLYANRNPLFNLMGVGDVQKTAERISYGQPLTTGSGMTLRPREETINAAMAVAPLAPAVGRVGRTVGRLAGEEINAAMTGQPTRSLLGQMTPKPKLLDVYHGTPHTLPPTERNPLGEFDASKIGTGEGAQSFGHGIYTAENPLVAKDYQFMKQNWFDTSKAKYKGKSINSWYEQAQKDQERAFRTKDKALEQDATARLAYWENIMTHNHPENVLKQFTDPEYGWDAATNYAKSIDLSKFQGIPRSGNLYKVDLPDEKIATMLDWDKPLSQQSPQVQAAIEKLTGIKADKVKLNEFDDALLNALQGGTTELPKQPLDPMGSDLYQRIIGGNPAQVAGKLQEQGIAGIKYLDQFSREAGQGTRNFVVFPNEEKSMTILERNGMPATPIESPTFTDPFGNTIGSSIR